jgi:hypothetical protein
MPENLWLRTFNHTVDKLLTMPAVIVILMVDISQINDRNLREVLDIWSWNPDY